MTTLSEMSREAPDMSVLTVAHELASMCYEAAKKPPFEPGATFAGRRLLSLVHDTLITLPGVEEVRTVEFDRDEVSVEHGIEVHQHETDRDPQICLRVEYMTNYGTRRFSGRPVDLLITAFGLGKDNEGLVCHFCREPVPHFKGFLSPPCPCCGAQVATHPTVLAEYLVHRLEELQDPRAGLLNQLRCWEDTVALDPVTETYWIQDVMDQCPPAFAEQAASITGPAKSSGAAIAVNVPLYLQGGILEPDEEEQLIRAKHLDDCSEDIWDELLGDMMVVPQGCQGCQHSTLTPTAGGRPAAAECHCVYPLHGAAFGRMVADCSNGFTEADDPLVFEFDDVRRLFGVRWLDEHAFPVEKAASTVRLSILGWKNEVSICGHYRLDPDRQVLNMRRMEIMVQALLRDGRSRSRVCK